MITCKLKGRPELIPDTALYFAAVAKRCGVSQKRADTLCFVIESTLELRAQELDDDNPELAIDFLPRRSDVVVRITDRGIPYVPTENQKKILRRGLVDSFLFEQLGAAGQRITFTMGRESATAVEESIPRKEEHLLDDRISCRRIRPTEEDILEAIRCIHSVWGYGYVHEDLYYIEYYREQMLSGRYISAMAENEHGQVLGHLALEEHNWFPGLPEMCNFVVKPFAQGLGLADKLHVAVDELGTQDHVEGFYVVAVTMHPRSQKIAMKHGFTPCGMIFHFAGPEKAGPMADGDRRLDAAVAVHILNRTKQHILYLPEECAPFVRRIFTREGLPYEEIPEKDGLQEERQPRVSYQRDAANRSLDIRIDSIGSGAGQSLEWFRAQEDGDVDVVTVFLNMSDPSCPTCYRYLREQGYRFSGCLPGSREGDYLILQDLKGFPIEEEKLILVPEFRELADLLLNN